MDDSKNGLEKDLEPRFDSIPFPIAVINNDGVFLRVNDSFKHLIGKTSIKLSDIFQTGINMNHFLNAEGIIDEQVVLTTKKGLIAARLDISLFFLACLASFSRLSRSV